jgi:hypothetical protein
MGVHDEEKTGFVCPRLHYVLSTVKIIDKTRIGSKVYDTILGSPTNG